MNQFHNLPSAYWLFVICLIVLYIRSTLVTTSTVHEIYNKQYQHDFHSEPSLSSLHSPSCEISKTYCTNNLSKRIFISMAAIPHTASTTTDRVFAARNQSWNISLPLSDRGFTCPSNKQEIVVTPQKCNHYNNSHVDISRNDESDSSLSTFDCVIKNLKYKEKVHMTYDNIIRYQNTEAIFTTLRRPEQTVLSHYRDRMQWDWTFRSLYPDEDLENIHVENFISKAWYRHNLFVKTLTTDTKLIFREDASTLTPTKEESDRENLLGKDSVWLHTAIERLRAMPFFGLFHRLTESFELFGFHLCIPVHTAMNETKKDRTVSKELDDLIQKHFVLDRLLLEAAEGIFDSLVADMREKKKRGMICDVSKLMGETTYDLDNLQLGLMCVDKLT